MTIASPRMIVKIDIEKAYDTISWKVILATLTKMKFSTLWISWIHSCISTPSCFFLINGQPSRFMKTSRGVRQGGPLSSYLFILVSHNLIDILNHALGMMNTIPGFNQGLTHNFNHLMYAGDLVLITKVSRSVARNIKFCLDIYSNLTGQKPNHTKSTIFFPKWFNSNLTRSICRTLEFCIGYYPFSYLVVSISPNRLLVSHFSPLISRLQRLTSFWNQLHITYAGKVILINSVLLSVPSYTLFVYHMPDSVLDQITRIARNFLWHKDGNRSDLPLVSWNRAMLDKPDGGLAMKNLKLVHTAYIAKNL